MGKTHMKLDRKTTSLCLLLAATSLCLILPTASLCLIFPTTSLCLILPTTSLRLILPTTLTAADDADKTKGIMISCPAIPVINTTYIYLPVCMYVCMHVCMYIYIYGDFSEC